MMKTILHQAIGDTPIVLSASLVQFDLICRALQLNPRRVVSGNDPQKLRGLKPTSIIYGPGWYYANPARRAEIDHCLVVLQRRATALRSPLPEFHLVEEDF